MSVSDTLDWELTLEDALLSPASPHQVAGGVALSLLPSPHPPPPPLASRVRDMALASAALPLDPLGRPRGRLGNTCSGPDTGSTWSAASADITRFRVPLPRPLPRPRPRPLPRRPDGPPRSPSGLIVSSPVEYNPPGEAASDSGSPMVWLGVSVFL
jgi:hypothetical protein